MKGIYIGAMDFAGYRVMAVGTSKGQVEDAIKKSVTGSVYWKESEWNRRSWASAWDYFSGHVQYMRFGTAEWH